MPTKVTIECPGCKWMGINPVTTITADIEDCSPKQMEKYKEFLLEEINSRHEHCHPELENTRNYKD